MGEHDTPAHGPENSKKEFPLEKILTTSLSDWLGGNLDAFNRVGVHHDEIYDLGSIVGDDMTEIKTDFAAKVPKDAIMVVDYDISMVRVGDMDAYISQTGTALVPKPAT